jgi:hypothetical protein
MKQTERPNMKYLKSIAMAAALLPGVPWAGASPMGTAFTYQGRLNDGGAPANGFYDFNFKLYDAATDGTLLNPPSGLFIPLVGVTNGLVNLKLDFGAVFEGSARWLDVSANTNGSTPISIGPRQELTPAPYALYAGTAGGVRPGGIISGMIAPGAVGPAALGVSPAAPAGNVLGYNGSNLVWQSQNPWLLGGNGATTPGTDFLGTTDNNSLYVKVNNQRALWIRPTAGVPNLIGGSLYNATAAGVEGAYIGGGGFAGADNTIYASYGALGGGVHNRIDARNGFLGGGGTNRIENTASFAVLAGGQENTLGGDHGVIAGGWFNDNQTALGTIGGGANNLVQAPYSATIAGGYQNTVQGQDAAIGGGSYNTISNAAPYAVVSGGQYNLIGTLITGSGEFYATNNGVGATISGGVGNQAFGEESVIGGGQNNWASKQAGTVAGGQDNRVEADYSVVGGGAGNSAGGQFGTVSGGSGNAVQAQFGSVGGGVSNSVWAQGSFIPGGAGAQTRVPGQMAHAYGGFSTNGDAQACTYILRGTSSDTNTFTSLLAGGSKISVPADTVVMFDIQLVGGHWEDLSSAYHITGGIVRSSSGTYLMSSSPHTDLEVHSSFLNATWRWRVVADAAANALDIQVAAGNNSLPTRWVATVRTTEVKLR